MPDLPTGNVTFLFTDIESSTKLWDTPMKLLNRNAVIIKPKQPYRDWIARLDGNGPVGADIEDTEYPVYLLPEATDDAHFQRILKKHYSLIFENELQGWYTDERAWPVKRDWKTFCSWFTVEYGSEVIDLDASALLTEDV